MSDGLDKMKTRAGFTDYDAADGRIVKGKYDSFKKALNSSYQAEWITLDKGEENERRWRCLINPSRLTEQFDKKVISIDFESGIDEGTVFYWDRTKRYWIVDLQQHTEEAYFRGTITRADYQIDVNGKKYWISIRGPEETTTVWNQKHGIAWNDLNYSIAITIAKDSNTANYFTRHKVIKFQLMYPDVDTGEIIEEWHNWKVVATDKYSEEKIMQVYLDEWYDNEMEDAEVPVVEDEPNPMESHIEGPAICYPFDTNLSFSIVGINGGTFVVNSNKVKINKMDETSCELEILSGKSFNFILSYVVESTGQKIDREIKVLPM